MRKSIKKDKKVSPSREALASEPSSDTKLIVQLARNEPKSTEES